MIRDCTDLDQAYKDNLILGLDGGNAVYQIRTSKGALDKVMAAISASVTYLDLSPKGEVRVGVVLSRPTDYSSLLRALKMK